MTRPIGPFSALIKASVQFLPVLLFYYGILFENHLTPAAWHLVSLLSTTLCLLTLLLPVSMLWDKQSRTLHDTLSRSFVCEKKRPVLKSTP